MTGFRTGPLRDERRLRSRAEPASSEWLRGAQAGFSPTEKALYAQNQRRRCVLIPRLQASSPWFRVMRRSPEPATARCADDATQAALTEAEGGMSGPTQLPARTTCAVACTLHTPLRSGSRIMENGQGGAHHRTLPLSQPQSFLRVHPGAA
jgi:hypothetical protein